MRIWQKKQNRVQSGIIGFLVLCITGAGPAIRAQVQKLSWEAITEKVTISYTAATADRLLKDLDDQTSYDFIFQEETLQKINLSGFRFSGTTLGNVLGYLHKEAGLHFSVNNKTIAAKKEAALLGPVRKTEPGKVTGKVVDTDNGQPISGASIQIGDKAATTDADGVFILYLPKGNYSATISHVSYGAKEITDVQVKDNETFTLNATLKAGKGQLTALVVKSSARMEGIAALFTAQKNRSYLSDGISAQQINATPDRHVGETLRRITGVSTQDNRKVVVRGIAERYNVPLLNGSPLPSTDVQERDFEFNLIPTSVVESIVVAKSVTADMPYGFAGGMVQINTRSVPASNFTSISGGLSVNSRTQGNDFLGYGRGKYDYLGFDDGGREHFPDGLKDLQFRFNPRLPDSQNEIKAPEVAEQNKRIGGTERLGTRVYRAMPSQNYQFSMGRVYALSSTKVRDLGFVGSVSYRNTQNNSYLGEMRRGSWSQWPPNDDESKRNTGNIYTFNTTLGVMLNGGFKTKHHQFNMYNLYTRIFDNRFSRITGWSAEDPSAAFPGIEEDDRPKFSDLLQHKISGSHQLSPVKIEWSLARTTLNSVEKDAAAAELAPRELGNKAPLYEYFPNNASDPGFGNLHRDKYNYKEHNTEAIINISYLFKLGHTAHTIKTGFNYLGKHAWYGWQVLPVGTGDIWNTSYNEIPLQEWGNHMDMKDPMKSLYYNPSLWSLNGFEAKSEQKGTFIMLDHQLLSNLHLVWGVRADYFKLDTLKNAASLQQDVNTRLIFAEKKDWYFLPSANLTYTLFNNLNMRASYAKTAVRPGLMENSRFSRYNPNYGTMIRSSGVSSTVINNYDAKVEWFPGAGEIVSAGYFYKYFDKPAEYYRKNNMSGGTPYISVTNSDWAKVWGWEFELRKNLGFIYTDWKPLSDMYVSANLTLQKSKVRAQELQEKIMPDGTDSLWYSYMKYPRALYGQVPVLYNLGIQYDGKRLGLNLVYNYMGYKTFVTAASPDLAEYERPRGQLDAQISYRFLNSRLEAKINFTNLTDAPFRFFVNNQSTYEIKPDAPALSEEWHDRYQYKPGYTDKFEEGSRDKDGVFTGDRHSLVRYIGRTIGFTVSYRF